MYANTFLVYYFTDMRLHRGKYLITACILLTLTGCSQLVSDLWWEKDDQAGFPEKEISLSGNHQLQVWTPTQAPSRFPAAPVGLQQRLIDCTQQSTWDQQQECRQQAIADYTVSKEEACQQDDGRHNRYLEVTRNNGYAQAPNFFKDGETVYYPVQTSSQPDVSCDQTDYELYLYQYNCTDQSFDLLVDLSEEDEEFERLTYCGVEISAAGSFRDNRLLLVEIFPYEWYGPRLDNYLLLDPELGEIDAVNIWWDSVYSWLWVVSAQPFVGFETMRQDLEDHLSVYLTGQQTGLDVMKMGSLYVDGWWSWLQGDMRHIYQLTDSLPGEAETQEQLYEFAVSSYLIDMLSRSIDLP